MMKKYGYRFILIILLNTLCNITFGAEPFLSTANIKQIIKTKKIPKDWLAIDESNVDFPIVKILQAYINDQAIDPVTAINTLEPVMTHTRFELQQPDGNALRSYFFWRDLMYTILSRSFYESGEAEKAYKYASAVQVDSVFYKTAKLQQIWAGLKLEKYEDAAALLKLIDGLELESREFISIQLQTAFLLFQQKNFQEVINTLDKVQPLTLSLKDFSNKLKAQSYFELHQLNSSDSNENKIRRLEKILVLIKDLQNKDNLSQFAYFAAEVYWTYASLIRIEDPTKNQKQILAALNTADAFIKPWIKKSLEKKKALLPEEAMFLSSVILWEQNKMEESIPRLLLTVELYPGTQYKEDIYQLIGDYYFEKTRYQESLTYYSLLSRSENIEKVSYGLYKAAWSFYNMKEKFKALRHFQRLVLHYKKEKNNLEQTVGTLYREAEADMFFVMGELLTATESLKELEMFKYSNADGDDVREKMSYTYNKLGKFEESMAVLKDLLANHTKNDNYYTWLYEVLTNQLNMGLRTEIASTIETYLRADQYQGSKQDFENKIISLQLVLHREAKKSDDADIWKATDAMYRVISQLSPNSQNADFWYFGAQRKEMQDQAWDAIAWYKKALAIPNYVNKMDAAVSILRIVKAQIDKTNLENHIENFQNCKAAAYWYIENFPDTEQKYSAIQFYLRSMLNLNEQDLAEDYILTSLEKSHFADKDWNNYLIYNKNLYIKQKWQIAFNLADRLIRSASVLPTQYDVLLREVRQESAFQLAYQFQVDQKNIDLIAVRDWYLKSIEVNKSNDNLRVKAWNNLLRTYHLPSEFNLLSNNYEIFKMDNFTHLTTDNRLLLVNLYAYVASAYEDIGYPLKKFEVLLNSSQFASNELQNGLRWNALVGFGTHYDLANFNKALNLLQGQSLLEDSMNKATLARLYFLLGANDKAWILIQEIWQTKKTTPAFFVLLRDFYISTEQENSLTLALVQDWLEKKENSALKQEPLLESIWVRQKWMAIQKSFAAKPLKNSNYTEVTRSLASVNNEGSVSFGSNEINNVNNSEYTEQMFNQRLAQVSLILVNLVDNKQRIKSSFGRTVPQLLVEAICQQSEESKKAAKDLALQRQPELNSPKWQHFISKLNEKILELEADANKETKLCEQKREEIALMDTLKISESPLCLGGKCPMRMPAADLESIKRESLRRHESPLDLVHNLVASGGWATAEYYAEQITDTNFKLLSMAYLRLAYNDRKSAMLLLRDLFKSPVKSHAAFLAALLAWSEHAYKKTQNYLDEIDTSALSSWENTYLKLMMNQP